MAAPASLRKEWQAKVAALAEREVEIDCPLTFVEFVNRVYPKYQWYRHNQILARSLQRVADGELKRLMVFQPPRHGKSLMTSKLFPAYCLYRQPDKWVAIASYAAELAYTFSRSARDAYLTIGGSLRDDSSSVKQWETPEGGGCWAAGVGGAATGRGFGSIGIIDDPIKNAEEASSSTIKNKQRDWYGSTFYTRAEPNAAIVVIQTRWAEDDLSGYLLGAELEDEPERWHIVNFEALKEDAPFRFPVTCTVEPDWRSTGEALCPERFNAAKLAHMKTKIGSRYFEALYQQRPRPADGDTFKETWFRHYPRLPDRFDQFYISVDATFKKTKSGSFVVIQLWGVKFPNFYLLHQKRDRMGFVATKEAIRQMIDYCDDEFEQLPSAVLIEDKANGPAVLDALKLEIAGLVAIEPDGSKEARAEAVSTYYESGNVWIPEASIATFPVKDYTDEFLSFPNGATDDQVDASSQLIYWVMQSRRNRRRHSVAGTMVSTRDRLDW